MERLQKKCIIGSACLHGVLLSVAVFGSGFFSPKPQMVKFIEMVPANAIITDGATRGGGNPNVTTAPAAGSPAAAPAPAQSKPSAPEKKAEPPKPAAIREPTPPPKPSKQPKLKSSDSFSIEKSKPKETAKRDLGLDKLTVKDPKKEKAAADKAAERRAAAERRQALEREARQRADLIENTISGIAGGLSKGVGVEVPGPGGQAFINYRDLIASAYQRRYDQMLLTAGDIARGDTSVDVAITIARDGNIVNSRITHASGNTTLNRLVQQVLDSVTRIAQFPEGAKDERRTFNLTFELKAKRLAG